MTGVTVNKYGFGENPPYFLYQNEDGKWGLVDGSGNRLPADFERLDEHRFSCVPWEIVTFNETEGYELQCWYDPCEVWFNFTWDDPAYPEEYAGYLWKRSKKEIAEYSQILFALLPQKSHWLAKAIVDNDNRISKKDDYDDAEKWYNSLIDSNPEVKDASVTNNMIDHIMRDKTIDSDIKCTLWQAKVSLDYKIRNYLEEND